MSIYHAALAAWPKITYQRSQKLLNTSRTLTIYGRRNGASCPKPVWKTNWPRNSLPGANKIRRKNWPLFWIKKNYDRGAG